MHSSKFSLILIAVSGCIAVIGAIPVGNRADAEAVVRRQENNGLGAIIDDLLNDVADATGDFLNIAAAPAPARRQTDDLGSAISALGNDVDAVIDELLGIE